MERYVIRGGREGYDRLQVLARVRWPDTSRLLDDIGMHPGMRCLDLGCGSGAVTLELADLVGPNGHVIGIDMDDVKLGLAREAARARGLENVEFRVANVVEWTEHEAYDLVYTRFLLQHLSEPLDVVRRMWSAVRPGGTLAVEDADFDGRFGHPPNDGFAFSVRSYAAVLTHNGGDPQVGRKLLRFFLEVGAPDPQLRLTQDVSRDGEGKSLALLSFDTAVDAVRAAALASDDEIAAARAELVAFTDDPTTLLTSPWVFQVWARKPSSRIRTPPLTSNVAPVMEPSSSEAADRNRLCESLHSVCRPRCDDRPVDRRRRDRVRVVDANSSRSISKKERNSVRAALLTSTWTSSSCASSASHESSSRTSCTNARAPSSPATRSTPSSMSISATA